MSVTVTLNCASRTIVSNRDNNGERRGYLGLVETRDRLEFCRGNKRLWCADAVDSLLYVVTLGRDGNVANFRYLLYSTSELRSSTHSRLVSLCHWIALRACDIHGFGSQVPHHSRLPCAIRMVYNSQWHNPLMPVSDILQNSSRAAPLSTNVMSSYVSSSTRRLRTGCV